MNNQKNEKEKSRTYLCKNIVDLVEFIFAFRGEEVRAFIPLTKNDSIDEL